jgi:hypothetical protein
VYSHDRLSSIDLRCAGQLNALRRDCKEEYALTGKVALVSSLICAVGNGVQFDDTGEWEWGDNWIVAQIETEYGDRVTAKILKVLPVDLQDISVENWTAETSY